MSQTETGEVDVSLALEQRLSELGFDVSDLEAVLEALSQVTLVPKHPTDQQLVEYAQAVLAHEGEIEIDDDAIVTPSSRAVMTTAIGARMWPRGSGSKTKLARRSSQWSRMTSLTPKTPRR